VARSGLVSNKITKNIFSNYVGIFTTILIAFFLSPFLVKTLGDTNYGIWSVIVALTSYMVLLDLGIGSAVAKYVAKYKALSDYKSLNIVIGSGISIMTVAGLFLIAISPVLSKALVSAFGFEDELAKTVRALIIISAIDIAIFINIGVIIGAFFGFQRFEIINAINIMASLFRGISYYLALSHGMGLLEMGIIALIVQILSGIALVLAMKTVEPDVEIKHSLANRETVSSIFVYSKFTLLSMIAMLLVYYSDAFVIGYFMSAAAITYYTIAWSLSEYTNKLILAIAQVFVPVFSEQEATKGSEAIYRTYVSGTKFMLLISNLLCIGFLASGDHFISLWMGPKYAAACSVILTILFITQLIKGPQLLGYSILLGTANHAKYSLYNFGFSVLNLVLSIALVQMYGLIGVASATAFTQCLFYGVFTPILTFKIINVSFVDFFKSTYLRILPSSLLLFVLLKYFAHLDHPDSYGKLLTQAGIATIVYLFFSFLTLLDDSEKKILSVFATRVLSKYK